MNGRYYFSYIDPCRLHYYNTCSSCCTHSYRPVKESSKFKVRSPFTDVGFTTNESEKVFILADFSKSPGLELKNMFKWLIPFKPLVIAGEVAKKMDTVVKLELTGKTWEKGVKKFINPDITLKTSRLKGKPFTETAANYVTRNKFDWVIIPKSKKESAKKLFSADISKKLVKSIDKPLLLY